MNKFPKFTKIAILGLGLAPLYMQGIRKSFHDTVTILIEMVTGKISHITIFFKKCLIPLSANGDHNENDPKRYFYYLFQEFVKNDRRKCDNTITVSRTVFVS